MSLDEGMSTFGLPPFDRAREVNNFVSGTVGNYGEDRQPVFQTAIVFLRRVLSGVRGLGDVIARIFSSRTESLQPRTSNSTQ